MNSRYFAKGATGLIFLEENGHVVRKVFNTGSLESDLNCARREFEYQSRFWQSLRGLQAVCCPRPLELTEDEPVTLRMEACSGITLQTYLLECRPREDELSLIAQRIAQGLLIYLETFGEPYYDFNFSNILYEPSCGRLTLLDFGKTLRLHKIEKAILQVPPLEFSLGWALGSLLYELSRPVLAVKGMKGRAVLELFEKTVAHTFLSSSINLSLDTVVRIGSARYKNAAFVGSWPRQGWYRTFGHIVATKHAAAIRKSLVRTYGANILSQGHVAQEGIRHAR